MTYLSFVLLQNKLPSDAILFFQYLASLFQPVFHHLASPPLFLWFVKINSYTFLNLPCLSSLEQSRRIKLGKTIFKFLSCSLHFHCLPVPPSLVTWFHDLPVKVVFLYLFINLILSITPRNLVSSLHRLFNVLFSIFFFPHSRPLPSFIRPRRRLAQ